MKRLLLYLLTTNSTKASHLRYLFSLKQIDLFTSKSFQGYPELQVDKASASLRAGALYLRKNFSSPFVIEDTEVHIEAYSRDAGISYPGFDLKRWWRVTTFAEIDGKCRRSQTRKAVQTSNLCLSVPGLQLLFFKGTVEGQISLEPYSGATPKEAPWLNSQEFGSIFIPRGATVPFASLNLAESLKYDFRKFAVDRAASRINEINAVLNLEPNCYLSDDHWVHDPNQLQLFEAKEDHEVGLGEPGESC